MSEASMGHNSVASEQLKSVIDRIERLNVEGEALRDDIKYVYSEAKGNGFDTKSIRKLVALRKKDSGKLAEEKAMLELYANAIGCLDLV